MIDTKSDSYDLVANVSKLLLLGSVNMHFDEITSNK